MTTPDLPPPSNAGEVYLRAILDELVQLGRRLPLPAELPEGTVELREPEVKASGRSGSGGEVGTPEPRPARKAAARKTSPRPRGGKTETG